MPAARWLLVAAVLSVGCSTETGAGRGEACTRTLQCQSGLACIDGACSADLDDLDEGGEVPDLMPEPEDAAADPAPDGAAADEDAGASS